jgi:hypothetical protein
MNPAARENFRQQAEWCERLGSPFTARICRTLYDGLDEISVFGAKILNWRGNPEADALALRACGALHFFARSGHPSLAPLYLPNAAPDADALARGLAHAIGELDAPLAAFLDRPPQTNEVARSAILLPGYLEIARNTRLALSIREIGASAGLNLWFERYRYDYGVSTWGDEDAKVRIRSEWRGPAPPAGELLVADRLGCDRAPIDPGSPDARRRMLAYIWADQSERLARAEAAMDLAAAQPEQVEEIDAAKFVARELSSPPPGRARVLVHSVFWQYLPEPTKASILATILEAAKRASPTSPFAWLRLESEEGERRGAVLRLSLWPNGPIDKPLAVASFHGAWIEWTGADERTNQDRFPTGRGPL